MGRDISLDVLSRVRIASPCDARWEDMTGDEKIRRCAQCTLNVHNLSAMTRREIESVLAPMLRGERVCGMFFRRADGTILTRDCPVGLGAARARLRKAAGRIAAALGAIIGGAGAISAGDQCPAGGLRLRAAQPFKAISDRLDPRPVLQPAVKGEMIMGRVAYRPTPPPPPPKPTLLEQLLGR